jgi:hypothetical protein
MNNNMITEKTVLTGTEEELLAYFKQKYSLIESCDKNPEPAQELLKVDNTAELKPALVQNKVTTGFGNLFGGTSWGN